jgi:hypothetical protein
MLSNYLRDNILLKMPVNYMIVNISRFITSWTSKFVPRIIQNGKVYFQFRFAAIQTARQPAIGQPRKIDGNI